MNLSNSIKPKYTQKSIKEIFSFFDYEKTLAIVKINKNFQKLLGIKKQSYQLANYYKYYICLNNQSQKELKTKISVKKIVKTALAFNNNSTLPLFPTPLSIETGFDIIYCIYQLNDQLIAISNNESKIKIINIMNQKCIKTLITQNSPIYKMLNDLNDSQSYFISASFNGELIKWDKNTFIQKERIILNDSGLISISIISNKNTYIASYWDLSIEVFDFQNIYLKIDNDFNQPIITISSYFDVINDEIYLLLSSRSKEVYIYYIDFYNVSCCKMNKITVSSFDDYNKYITYIFPYLKQDKMVLGYNNGSITAMNLKMNKCFYNIKPHNAPLTKIQNVDERNLISIAFKDPTISIFQINDMRNRITLVSKIYFDCDLLIINNIKILTSSKGIMKILSLEDENYSLKFEAKNIIIKEKNQKWKAT